MLSGFAIAKGNTGHGRPVVDHIFDGVGSDADLVARLRNEGFDKLGPKRSKHHRYELRMIGVEQPDRTFICPRDAESLITRPVAFGPLFSAATALYLANQANIEAYLGRSAPCAFADICLQVRWGAACKPEWHFDHVISAVHANMTLHGVRTVMFKDINGEHATLTRDMVPGMQYLSLRSHRYAGTHAVSYPEASWENAVITVQFRMLAADRDEIDDLDRMLENLYRTSKDERERREGALLEGFKFPFVHHPRLPCVVRQPVRHYRTKEKAAERLCSQYRPERAHDAASEPLVHVPPHLVKTLLEFFNKHQADFQYIFNSETKDAGEEASGDDEGAPRRSRLRLVYSGGSSLFDLSSESHKGVVDASLLADLQFAQARYAKYHPRFRLAVDDLVRLVNQLVGSTVGPHSVEALLAEPGTEAQERHKDCPGRNLNVLVYLTDHEGTVMVRGGKEMSSPRKPGDLGVSWTDDWHYGPGNDTDRSRFGVFLSYGPFGTDGIIKYSDVDVDMQTM